MLKKYYYPPVNFWSIWFSEALIRFLYENKSDIRNDDVILDVGCGLGYHCYNLEGHDPKEINGCDISDEIIEVVKSFYPSFELIKLDVCRDDISKYFNKYSIIFSSDVYEHVDDPQIMLNNIDSMLKDNGILCMTFPNNDYH